ncbi:cysteine--tRNA ligase [Pseudaestuariivita rosea]|uniref:cysteine--tRNA ligase n=1 Tax=Pseudaestuariivita rosea TaxID=2763263 RepID=UPI001ABB155E|nr:cysteine--tRNA ligase [Pseudaestuariivita rosea]
MTTIKLTNTKTRQKEVFEPLDPKNVRMYVCGPTVYDRAHLGNARPVVVFDVLFRLLRHVYGADHVTYVRNFTDVDDKINARAAETGRAIEDITAETAQWYLDDMAAIGAMEPTHMPRATQYIPQMVAMIEGLIEKGHAYEAEGHVLFAVESYENYGKLSGRSIDDMIAGARVEVAPYKRNPMDFVLWKPSTDDLPGWDSPWGRGRPGWHIECSAMADDLLGETFDIHGGGIDLQFPHHENEIAQSMCAHPKGDFARYWLHNEMLQVEGKKMSKSLGNFFTVRDLLDQGVPGEVIRFVMLSTHYSKPMDWTEKKREEAERRLRKWAELFEDPMLNIGRPWTGGPIAKPPKEIVDALANDLNTSLVLTKLNEFAKKAKVFELASSLIFLDFNPDALVARFCNPHVQIRTTDYGVTSNSGRSFGSSTRSHQLYRLRELSKRLRELHTQAMETKDFSLVDNFKSVLVEAGVEVRMSKEGVDLNAGPNFNPTKLEALE